ncbi:MAG: CU044_2847 family protein [Microcoleaceae cyanobacterium]
MTYSEERKETIPVELPNGAIVRVEVAEVGGREDVASSILSFKPVTDALEGVTEAIASTLEKAKPTKATVKFGMEISVESGKLTTAIIKGSGKGNLEITLEWDNKVK